MPDMDDTARQQYKMVAERRQHFDLLLWQAPMISLTAQAFLFNISLGNSRPFERSICCALGILTALASIHLLSKHKFYEVYYARMQEDIETKYGLAKINGGGAVLPYFRSKSAYKIWSGLFWCFAAAQILVLLNIFKFFELPL